MSHTGTILGKQIASHKGIWWGYTGAVTAPTALDPFRQKQRDIFRFIQNQFGRAATKEDIYNVLNELKDKCDRMLLFVDEQIEDYPEDYPDADLLEIYSWCRNIWERLRVWHPANDEPLMHKESKGLLLF